MKLRYYIIPVLILSLGVMAYRVMASSVGPSYPASGTDDSSIGTVAWLGPGNITALDSTYASTTIDSGPGRVVCDNVAKLIKGGVVSGNNNATSTVATICNNPQGTNLWVNNSSWGSSSDLWGLVLAPVDVNATNFGFVESVEGYNSLSISHYLSATNFGFSIPSTATINGVLVEMGKAVGSTCSGTTVGTACVDYVRITITYTTSSGTPQVQIRQGQMTVRSGNLILK